MSDPKDIHFGGTLRYAPAEPSYPVFERLSPNDRGITAPPSHEAFCYTFYSGPYASDKMSPGWIVAQGVRLEVPTGAVFVSARPAFPGEAKVLLAGDADFAHMPEDLQPAATSEGTPIRRLRLDTLQAKAIVEHHENAPEPLRFRYTNHRGVTEERVARVNGIVWGATDWHPEPQWLVDGFCLDRGENRLFALRDMTFGEPFRSEETSARVAAIAARGMRDPSHLSEEEVRSVCASALTQRQPDAKGVLVTETYQARVDPWLEACFGLDIARDMIERSHRFLEEALELVQAADIPQVEAHRIVRYVYGRAKGDMAQEVGGTMTTLAALCLAAGIDMHEQAEIELARVWTPEVLEKVRAKQAAKPRFESMAEVRHPLSGVRLSAIPRLMLGEEDRALAWLYFNDDTGAEPIFALNRWPEYVPPAGAPERRTRFREVPLYAVA